MAQPDYREAMIRAEPALRAVLALDTVFLLAYGAFFVVFVRAIGVAGSGHPRAPPREVIGVSALHGPMGEA